MKLISCFTHSCLGMIFLAGVAAWASPQQTLNPASNNSEKLHAKAVQYRQLADEMNREADRRSRINAALYQKFPRPADSARSLAEYYTRMAASLDSEAQPAASSLQSVQSK